MGRISRPGNPVSIGRKIQLGKLCEPLLNSGPGLDDVDKANIVTFLKALTDERVRYRQVPFDHPEIQIHHGHTYDWYQVESDFLGNGIDLDFTIPAVGAGGVNHPLPTFQKNLLA